jgi:hypothetical protein
VFSAIELLATNGSDGLFASGRLPENGDDLFFGKLRFFHWLNLLQVEEILTYPAVALAGFMSG